MSPSGKAPDFDSGIRRFESCHPSHDPLAQLAEQLPFKQWVWSSNLQRVTKMFPGNLMFPGFFLCIKNFFRLIGPFVELLSYLSILPCQGYIRRPLW